MNNLFLGPDAQARFLLQNLRAHKSKGSIAGPETQIMDGVRLSNDPEARIKGSYSSNHDEMLSLQMHPTGAAKPRWQSLQFVLGDLPLSDAMVFGVVVKSRAPQSITTRICLRSGRDGEYVDVYMPKTMVSYDQPSTHIDVLEIDKSPDVPRNAQWRDLIFFIRPGEVELNILDLRLFAL